MANLNIQIQVWNGSSFVNLNHKLIAGYNDSFELNRFGDFNFEYPVSAQNYDLLVDRVIVLIYENGVLRNAGKVIQNVTVIVGGAKFIRIQGLNIMLEFVEDFTIANIGYNNEQLSDLLDPSYPKTLIRPTNWVSTLLDASTDFTYLSSLQSSFAMFGIVNRQSGLNFRWRGDDVDYRKIEWGFFGDSSGVRLRKKPKSSTEFGADLLVVQQLTIEEDYRDIENHLYVLGGGGDNGVNQLTLRDVDPLIIDPAYPILIDVNTPNDNITYDGTIFAENKTGPNNFAAYYLEDTASITQYGRIKSAYEFNDIFPQPSGTDATYTDADRQRAANELYRAAVNKLKATKDKQIFYRVTAYGETNNFTVGDTINLKYQGQVTKIINGRPVNNVYVNINDDFYVTRMRVNFTAEGKQFELELSDKAILSETDGDIIADTIKTVKVGERQRSGSVTTYPVHYIDSFDSSNPAKFKYWIPKGLVYTNYIDLKLVLRGFRSYSTGAASGGGSTQTTTTANNHTHDVPGSGHSHGINIPLRNSTTGTIVYWAPSSPELGTSGGGMIVNGAATTTVTPGTVTSVGSGSHSHNVTLPSHTHSLQFGIFEDTTPPSNVTLWIDGVNYSASTEIGGGKSSFGDFPSGANDTYSILKAAIQLSELDDLLAPGIHEIEIRCGSGRGLVELFIYNQFYLASQ